MCFDESERARKAACTVAYVWLATKCPAQKRVCGSIGYVFAKKYVARQDACVRVREKQSRLPGTQGNLSLSSEFRSLLSLIICFWRLFNRVHFVVKILGVSRSEWWDTVVTSEE